MPNVEAILKLFHERGHSEYGGEPVTQLEHALQCATLAEAEQASPALIAAALLHDAGRRASLGCAGFRSSEQRYRIL